MPEAAPAASARTFKVPSLVAIPAFGLLAGGMMALRIIERNEIWLDRTIWLVGLATLAGMLGALITRIAGRVLLRWPATGGWIKRYPRLSAAMLFAGAFMLAMTLAFVLHMVLIGGQIEAREGRPFWAYFLIVAEISALFLISCPTYLLPWPLPALMLAAGWLLPTPDGANPGKTSQSG